MSQYVRFIGILPILALLTVLLTDCGGGGDGFSCPSEHSNATFASFGVFKLNDAGRDSTARRIISECGWSVDGYHNGGVGNTLQIVSSPNKSVVLVWAYNDFYGFELVEGWTGFISGNIQIGDHVTYLYSQHPTFQTNNGTTHSMTVDGTRVIVNTKDGFIVRIYVGYYLR